MVVYVILSNGVPIFVYQSEDDAQQFVNYYQKFKSTYPSLVYVPINFIPAD